jgi:hypothetical protein
MPPENEWLIVVDMQRAFADPPSPWAAPDFYKALAQVERLLPAYRGRAVLTRYVPPKGPTGAWIPYFELFPFALRPEDDPLWDLKLPAGAGVFIETRTTFSNWDESMAGLTGPGNPIAVCGVATECCVLTCPRRHRSRPLCPTDSGRLRRRLSPRRGTGARDPLGLCADGQRGEHG